MIISKLEKYDDRPVYKHFGVFMDLVIRAIIIIW